MNSKFIELDQKYKFKCVDSDKHYNNMTEYIYLLHVYSNDPDKIYKLGQTTRQFELRYATYKKTQPLIEFVVACELSKTIEHELLIQFRKKFTERKDIGREYFMGDVKEMKKTIMLYMCSYVNEEQVGVRTNPNIPSETEHHDTFEIISDSESESNLDSNSGSDPDLISDLSTDTNQIAANVKEPIEIEKKPLIPFKWEDVEKLWSNWYDMFMTNPRVRDVDYQVFLLLSLYVLLPPLRAMEWLGAKIFRLSKDADLTACSLKERNLIDLTSRTLVLSDYKGIMTYGVRIVPFNELSDDNGQLLTTIIEKWMLRHPDDKYLFETKTGQPIAEQNLTKLFNKIKVNEHAINLTELKEFFISKKIRDQHLSPERIKRLSYIMGQPIQV